MIRPKSKTTFKDKSPAIKKALAKAAALRASVGIHEDAGEYDDGTPVGLVAICNEFGTEYIPERSFLRSAINEGRPRISEWQKELLGKVQALEMTPEKAMAALGLRAQILIQNKIKSNVPPPNAPSTQAGKERRGVPQRTLMDTTLMLRSVGFKVDKI